MFDVKLAFYGTVCVPPLTDKSDFNGVYEELIELLGLEVTLKIHEYFKGQQVNFPMSYLQIQMLILADIFYMDNSLEKLYSGIVVDYFKGLLSWEFEVQDGFRTGIERKYYDTGELMEENDTNHNTLDGVAKEFYRNGNIKSISIVIRNVFTDTIFYDESGNKINKTSINESNSSYFLVEKKIDEYRKKYKIEK